NLYRGLIYSKIAKIVWDELKETYDKQYREFDIMYNLPECSCDRAPALKKHNDLLKLMQFLMRLDDVYTPIRMGLRKELAIVSLLVIQLDPVLVRSVNEASRADSSDGITHALTSDQYKKLMNLLSSSGGNPADAQVNVAEFGMLACKPTAIPTYHILCIVLVRLCILPGNLKSAFKVLRYFKGFSGIGLGFKPRKSLDLRVYVDSNWAWCKVTRKSVTGFLVFLGENLVSWKSKKQYVLA
ncbi:hypothetical protein Tco_0456529, partial [Tanacetum coccineum]